MKTSIIVAIAQNYAIGKDNDLLWRMPADMKMFRTLTTGHTVVMGRKTFESLPGGPLPNRKNIVISRTMSSPPDGSFVVYPSLPEFLKQAGNDETFIIGGAQIYKEAMQLADNLYITWIKHSFENADTFFPEINFNEWKEVSKEDHQADEKNPFDYSFVKYERI